MKYIYLGKLVNTHGIKGEVRIVSDFKYKKQIFKPDFKLYIGPKKEEVTITHYRPHKIYDMVTLKGFNNIDDVLRFKGMEIYFNRDDLKIDYLDEELIGLEVFDLRLNKVIGTLSNIKKLPHSEVLQIDDILIPYNNEFVKKIEGNRITVETIGGMVDED